MSEEQQHGDESRRAQRPQPRPRLQFSLRTLMVAVLLIAAALAWLMRPKHEARLLSNDAGRVWQEYRQDGNGPQVRHGRWELTGRDGQLLVRGRFADDRPQGRWTAYHANGQAALRGVCVAGRPVDSWNAWFPDGRRQAEFAFSRWPSAAGHAADGSPPGETCRSGPLRLWWPTGQLRMEGQFVDDREEGVWSFYNPQGVKLCSGPFDAGRRHGVWTFWNERGEKAEQVLYVHGRWLPDAAPLLTALTDHLCRGPLAERVSAARTLETLGSTAVPALAACLPGSDHTAQALAIRTLAQIGRDAAHVWPQIEPYLRAPEVDVRRQARLAGLTLDIPHGPQHAEALLRMLDDIPPTTATAVLVRVFSVRETRTAAYRGLLQRAVSENPVVRRQAVAALAGLCAEAMPLLTESLQDPVIRIRLAVVDVAVAALDSEQREHRGHAHQLLAIAAQDEDARIQQRAQAAWGRGGWDGGFF